MAACVRAWDRHVRGAGYPQMSVHPAGTSDHVLPTGHLLDKASSRLVFQWPGHERTEPAGPMAAAPTEAGGGQ
ncbi:hypothetical protein [Streptomyces kronopolitis]|uniref:hypothetical protein n=1 Tax=Streptomyces kronopolitis TaxID=1612435 RepID=UPI003D998894